MIGLNEFLELFGDITILQLVWFILAVVFVVASYRKFRDYLIKKHENEKVKDDKINKALAATEKYPEYRRQSLEIQKMLKDEIQDLRRNQEALTNSQNKIMERLASMEERTDRRDRNKIRDILLQNYRYYTNKETNPTQSWTRTESETFWELFRDYEEAGGNGYMHDDVMPSMQKLRVID
jgi:predicted secreted protein